MSITSSLTYLASRMLSVTSLLGRDMGPEKINLLKELRRRSEAGLNQDQEGAGVVGQVQGGSHHHHGGEEFRDLPSKCKFNVTEANNFMCTVPPLPCTF